MSVVSVSMPISSLFVREPFSFKDQFLYEISNAIFYSSGFLKIICIRTGG